MNWEEELLELYEKNSREAGIVRYKEYQKKNGTEKVPYVLLPPFHTTVTAQIEVVIDEDGNFLGASRVANEDKMTMIPVTEKSGSRTAGKEPHPLCDNLKYLAGDYSKYVKDEKENASEYYDLYMQGLEQWRLSEYNHKKVDAVCYFLKKQRLIQELIQVKVLEVDEHGYLDETARIQNIPQSKAFVRFIVRQKMSERITEEACWKDQSLQECFLAYYRSCQKESELDYVTGHWEAPTYLHSKKIRNEGDGAKLISSNDEANYTFRGRFLNKEQAFVIGSETSQKIHNALKWIIRKQGHHYDTLTMVTWESNMLQMPVWDTDTDTIMEEAQQDISGQGADSGMIDSDFTIDEDLFSEDYIKKSEEERESEKISDGNLITAKQFYRALNGYRKHIDHTSRMVLMAFDAATTGRLALAEYKALETGRYLKNIEKWHSQCAWLHTKYKNGGRRYYLGIPGIKEIADILYGSDSKGILTINDKNGKRLYAETGKRLMPCIWDGRSIPYDLVRTAVNKASAPQSYKERYNWEKVLALACSFVKKHRFETDKEEWEVALDENCRDKNYLYGRLLAVADRIEYRTFDTEKDSGRVTNAKRYMSAFAQRPFSTWKVIEENLQPYLGKLKLTERKYYENLIDQICQLFEVEGFRENTKLDGLYLLGFHSQSFQLKNYKKEETDGGNKDE